MKAANGSSEYLFPGPTGEPITTIKTIWRSICREAELERVRVHDLRHTYASVLASSGLSLPVIGALLGHTQPQTTARYAHLLDDPLRQATEGAAAVITASTTADVLPLRRSGR
jgi:integrase